MFSFEGKTVWVTGSSSGIGKATGIKFVELGANVVFHGLNKDEFDTSFIEEYEKQGKNVLWVEGDVSNKQEVQKMVQEIEDKYGQVDILINSVGAFVKKARFEQIEEEIWDKTVDINLKSVYNVINTVFPIMNKEGAGRIINITSSVARNGGTKEGAAYAAAKGGVTSLTYSLAKQLTDYNILVNGISPGLIDSNFHDSNAPLSSYGRILEQIPLKRAGQPKEVAGVAVFLASEYASYIVGEIIEVSGGRKLT